MGVNFGILSTFLLLLLAHVEVQASTIDVTKFGAKPNADISQALLSAWKEACAAPTATTVVIPKGNFLLNAVSIAGPCKAPVGIQLQGNVKAPSDPASFPKDAEWVTIKYINSFTLSGGGTFDGNGAAAWAKNDCQKTGKCGSLPNSLSLNFLNNSIFHDVTTLNSKLFHVNVLGCHNLTFQRFTITAPEESLNTDGIHIAKSTMVNVIDSNIGTGDDCVSIGDGTEEVHVTRVKCGPGHGISVGSLGKTPGETPVRGIYVKNCTFIRTMNGVRIKTWPDSHPGDVSDIHFEDIIMDHVMNPVIVDQVYCPSGKCSQKSPSKVKLSKMSFANIRGTSATQAAVKISCSRGVPCSGVTIGEINLTYSGKGGPATSVCENVKPTFTGKQFPSICSGHRAA